MSDTAFNLSRLSLRSRVRDLASVQFAHSVCSLSLFVILLHVIRSLQCDLFPSGSQVSATDGILTRSIRSILPTHFHLPLPSMVFCMGICFVWLITWLMYKVHKFLIFLRDLFCHVSNLLFCA